MHAQLMVDRNHAPEPSKRTDVRKMEESGETQKQVVLWPFSHLHVQYSFIAGIHPSCRLLLIPRTPNRGPAIDDLLVSACDDSML